MVDPDRVFGSKLRTCVLEDIFTAGAGAAAKAAAVAPPTHKSHSKRDWHKRGSSGNWIADRITWQEEMGYKRVMGFAM